MKIVQSFLLGSAGLILVTLFYPPQYAQANYCTETGYTVVFVNGILKSREESEFSAQALQKQLGINYQSEPITIQVGYNQTHLAGAGDLIEGYFPTLNTYDLNTILMELGPKVTTRKILLVGHSQGSTYTNAMYEYLVGRGVSREAIAVYNVATPEDHVVGGGLYATDKYDVMINTLRSVPGFNPLPGNLQIADPYIDLKSFFGGHSFVNSYLAGAPERIVGDIYGELGRLKADATSPCFAVPDATLTYRAASLAFAVADPAAVVVRDGSVLGYRGALAVADAVTTAAQLAYDAASTWWSAALSSLKLPQKTENTPGSFDAFKALYGSSVDEKILKKGLGAAAILATINEPAQGQGGEVLGAQVEAPAKPFIPPSDLVPMQPGFGQGGGGGAAPAAGAQSAPEPVHQVVGTLTAPTPPEPEPEPEPVAQPALAAPVMQFIGWSSELNHCVDPLRFGAMTWEQVPGAVEYFVYINDVLSGQFSTSGRLANFSFFDSAHATLRLVAVDAAGRAASSTIDLSEARLDKTPPSIAMTAPALGSTNVSLSTPVVLTFSEPLLPMDTAYWESFISLWRRLPDDTFRPTWTAASANASWTAVTLTLREPLEYSSDYYFMVVCNIADLSGNHPATAPLWYSAALEPAFRTEAEPAHVEELAPTQ